MGEKELRDLKNILKYSLILRGILFIGTILMMYLKNNYPDNLYVWMMLKTAIETSASLVVVSFLYIFLLKFHNTKWYSIIGIEFLFTIGTFLFSTVTTPEDSMFALVGSIGSYFTALLWLSLFLIKDSDMDFKYILIIFFGLAPLNIYLFSLLNFNSDIYFISAILMFTLNNLLLTTAFIYILANNKTSNNFLSLAVLGDYLMILFLSLRLFGTWETNTITEASSHIGFVITEVSFILAIYFHLKCNVQRRFKDEN